MIVLVIALIVLGPKRLPEAGKSLGKGMREFKDSLSGITAGDDDDDYSDNGLPPAAKVEEPTVTAASTTSSTASAESSSDQA